MGNTVVNLGKAEQVLLTIAPAITGLLSCLGSGTILYAFARDWKKKMSNIKYRLLACISFSDLVNSVCFATWTLPVPKDIPDVWGNLGNLQSCEIGGFLMHIGNITAAYNSALAIYFLLSLVYKRQDKTIACQYEKYFHLWGLAWPLGTGIAAWALGLYNFSGLGCWIAPYPYMCHLDDAIECTRGANAYLYAWIFTGIPIFICNGLIVYCMFRTYHSVRNTYERAQVPIQRAFSAGHIPEQDAKASRQRYAEKIKQSGIQAFLYSAAYILTHLWSVITAAYENTVGPAQFWMVFLHLLLWPLQGFFNVFIFLRPTIIVVQKRHPEYSYLHAAYLAAFYEKEPGRTSFTANAGFSMQLHQGRSPSTWEWGLRMMTRSSSFRMDNLFAQNEKGQDGDGDGDGDGNGDGMDNNENNQPFPDDQCQDIIGDISEQNPECPTYEDAHLGQDKEEDQA